MTHRRTNAAKAGALRDLAVHAVMTRGTLERSGSARLAILRDEGLMIGYRTPFNPLPPVPHAARYEAALKGDTFRSDPYGIDVWLEDFGKVFSASWNHDGALNLRLCRAGAWQSTLAAVAMAEAIEPDAKTDVAQAEEDHAVSRGKAQAAIADQGRIAAAKTTQQSRLRALEQENKKLRRAISGLMIDKLILAKAAAGKL